MSETNAPAQQMPIFSKTYDLLVWLLYVTRQFATCRRGISQTAFVHHGLVNRAFRLVNYGG
jgi:hypothetical protein